MIANGLGVIIYLGLASHTWIEPALRNEPGASGGAAVVWAVTALPILLAFLAANVIWSASGLISGLKRGDWRDFSWALGVGALWIAAALVDFSQHGSA